MLLDALTVKRRLEQKVDRIVELVDDCGACDDKLRATIYEAFGTQNV